MSSSNDPRPAKAVTRTVQIIEALADEEELGVTAIAGRAGLSKATAYRFLGTLEQLGYVRQNRDTENYALTYKLLDLADRARSRRSGAEEIRRILKQLNQETGETVHLAILDDDRLVYIEKLESPRSLRVAMVSHVGRSAPLHCTALGKVLLANLHDPSRSSLLDRLTLTQYTPNTITDRRDLESHLVEVRRHGVAEDNEEYEIGVRCMAAPIYNRGGETVAALSISVPSVRLTPGNRTLLENEVRRTAEALSNADILSALIGASATS